jgi:NAD(P)-dependent dehydrogenase (short-subunit alcohol dehydrogenase family)
MTGKEDRLTMTSSMQGKTCLVTGATQGIGRETAKTLAGLGAQVILVGRNPEKTLAAARIIQEQTGNPRVDYLLADLSSFSQVRRLADELLQRYDRLHVLVNVAGGVFLQRQVTVDHLEMTFGLNALSPFLLTGLLADILKKSAPSRIVNVSSLAHVIGRLNFEDLQSTQHYEGWTAYARSKLAVILFTYELARRLAGSGVTANVVHPGYVATNFGMNNARFYRSILKIGQLFAISPAKGAETISYLASSPEVEGVNGYYYVNKRKQHSSRISYDTNLAGRLWQVSQELTGMPSSV